jgi:uncharacterized protein with FMN-binding domain
MKKNQKMVISAATLAVLASSLAGACGSQSQSLSQVATDLTDGDDIQATASADPTATDDTTTAASSGTGSVGSGSAIYADGTYTGDAASTRWGDVQVSVTVADGSISNVRFLSYPDGDSRSAQINGQATGMLAQEAIQVQSAEVQVISGATFTSEAFIQSLDSALSQAV